MLYRVALATMLVIAASPVRAQWQVSESDGPIQKASYESDFSEIEVFWSPEIVPGESLANLREFNKRYRTTTYMRYTFMGIENNSLRVEVRGSIAEPNATQAQQAPSMSQELMIKRGADGAFYFVPTAIRSSAMLRIASQPGRPGTYAVRFVVR